MRGWIRFLRSAGVAAALVIFAIAQSGLAGANATPARTPVHAAKPFAKKVVVRTVKGGLKGPAGFTFAPSGRIYFLERGTGRVRFYNTKNKNLGSVFKIKRVDGNGERGALGIALSPRWPAKPFIYVYVTRRSTATSRLQNQLVRIHVKDGKGVGMKVLFTQPVSSASNHNGGRILFGPDSKLYIVIGENADPANAQNLANLRGKMLRVNAPGNSTDGTQVTGNFRHRIFAYGIRNSFGFTFDPIDHRLWETENGPSCNDEINVIKVGGNYGWGPSESCGSQAPPGDTNNSGPMPRTMPLRYFSSTLGITGDAFCHSCGLGAANEGRLFFGCVNDGILRSVALNGARTNLSGPTKSVLTAPSSAIYSMEVAPNGRIYFSNDSGIFRLALG